MSKQVLSIDQMKHLKELGLNIERASFLVHIDRLRDKYSEDHIFNTSTPSSLFEYEVETFPVFSLYDIIDLLPKELDIDVFCHKWFLMIDYQYLDISYSYMSESGALYSIKRISVKDIGLINGAYEMLCWCLENGYVEKDFEDYETKV